MLMRTDFLYKENFKTINNWRSENGFVLPRFKEKKTRIVLTIEKIITVGILLNILLKCLYLD